MDKIRRILESYVADGDVTENRVLGASLIVVTPKDTIYEGVAGRTGVAMGSPDFALDSSGWIASMTKLVTATALMQIVEKKLIGLDDDVRQLVPELAAAQILKPILTDDDEIRLDSNGNTITLRQLLTHTSGFGYDVADPDIQKWSTSVGRKDKAFDQTRERWNTPLSFTPGASWKYGTGIDWAGQVLEKVTGQRLGAYMSDNIFQPLGMVDTTFNRAGSAENLTGRILECCYRTSDGSLVGGPPPAPEDPSQDSGGSGLFSTARDYSIFIQALLADSRGQGTLLLKPTVDEIFRQQLNDTQSQHLHASMKDSFPFPADTPVNHGISGVINLTHVDGKRRKGSLTWGGMTNGSWWIDPESGIAAVLFVNLLPPNDGVVRKLYDELERAVYEDLKEGEGL